MFMNHDDVLVLVADSKSTVTLINNLDVLVGSGGFKLAKLSSNLPAVLEALPPDT